MLPVISLERGTGLVVAPKKPFCSSCLVKTWELGKGTDRPPHDTATKPVQESRAWARLVLALHPCAVGCSGTAVGECPAQAEQCPEHRASSPSSCTEAVV